MKKVVCVITLVGFLFSACTSLQMVSFDRLQAADVNYPELVRRVGVVNHAPVALSLAENDSLSSLEADGQVVAEVLAQGIAASNYFDQVVIGDSALSNSENGRASVLSQEEADELIRSMGVDMLFSIDRINVLLKKEAYMGYSEDLNWVPMTDAVISPVLVAHVYGRPPLFSVSKSDTLCWEVNSALTYERIARESAEYAAGLLADCLLPQWTEQQRFYFDGGNVEMRDAGVCVREQDWEGAASLWQNAYNRSKGKKKLRAAYNLALYHEMQDDFVQAEEYLKVAESLSEVGSWEAQLIQLYRSQLEEQELKYQKLKIQMKRFE